MNMRKWDVKWGDTLSEIAVTLLPGQPKARKKFMQETVKLNPNVFPTQDPDFMLAWHTLLIPGWVNSNNMQQTVEKTIQEKNLAAQAQQPQEKFEPLYQAPEDLISAEDLQKEEDNRPRFYALSPDGEKTDFKVGDKIKDQYQYITQGEIYGALQIPQGPYFLLTPNTRIKITLPRAEFDQPCKIELVQGLIRMQERNSFKIHCQIVTRYARLNANNADFGVQMCADKSCLINTQPEGKAWLPAGLYFGVAQGTLTATDKKQQYKLKKGQINYYAPDKQKALAIKPFKGLIFTDKELKSFEKAKPVKKKFSWGYIQTNPSSEQNKQTDDFINTLDLTLPSVKSKADTETKPLPENKTIAPATSDLPGRFN